MAIIGSTQATVLYDSGKGAGLRKVIYQLRNVTSADTYDVAAYFAEVAVGSFVADSELTGVGTVGIAGTVLTLTLATMAKDSLILVVKGQTAS